MQMRSIGQSNISASVIGLGTWNMGGWMWGGVEESDAISAIHASLDAGITLIDTAPAYGLGRSEAIVGKAIAGRRDQIILATKCGLVWHTQQGTHFFDEEDKPVYRFLGADSIRHEVEESLKRLGTDYIDLYQTHWQDATTPIEETMQTLLDLKQEGKIRAIGVSNLSTSEMDSYRSVGQLDSDQENYSMLDRDIEADLLPYTRRHDMAMLAYSPLALGLLTGKIGPDRQFDGDDQRIDNPRFSVENRQRVREMLEGFQPIARSRNLTIPQLVIAWTVAQPGITHVLVGARNAQQAIENAKTGTVKLSNEELETMNDVISQFSAEIV